MTPKAVSCPWPNPFPTNTLTIFGVAHPLIILKWASKSQAPTSSPWWFHREPHITPFYSSYYIKISLYNNFSEGMMLQPRACTTSALNEGQSHIPKGENSSKYQLIRQIMLDDWIVRSSTSFSGHSTLKPKARAAYPKDYYSFIHSHQAYYSKILP
jgi:hypothetical protein